MTQISPVLAVSDGIAAIAFYQRAFGAVLQWHRDGGGHASPGFRSMARNSSLAPESPPHGTCAPAPAGFTTVRIELFVDDPVALHRQAVTAGAVER